MKIVKRTPFAFAALSMAVPLALAGCERRDEPDQEPAPALTRAPEVTDTPQPETTQSPVASIIRDDALPGPIIEVPPQPLRLTVPFEEGGSELSPRAERILAGSLDSDALGETWPIVLRGHTDASGDDQGNLRASRARAEAVAAWLVEHGVDGERIALIALGEQNPVAPNALPNGEPNETGRARNRRVEMEIVPPPAATPPADPSEGAAPPERVTSEQDGA